MKRVIKLALIVIGIALLASCAKNSPFSAMKVRMTDAPGDFDKVLVEIVGVNIHYSGTDSGNEGWVSMETKAGVYDLLTLQNNVTAVLADDTKIPSGSVDQIRLVLGSNNSVVIENVSFPLETPSAEESGLKINMNLVLSPEKEYDVLLDFNAEESVVVKSAGLFLLKPVITLKGVTELN